MRRYLAALGLALAVFGWILLPPIAPKAAIPAVYPGNAAYSIGINDRNVLTSVAFSASRTWTLPSAGGYNYDQLYIIDAANTVTSTNTLVIAPQSGETINGAAANLTISNAGAVIRLVPLSGSGWKAEVVGRGPIGQLVSSTLLVASAVSLTTNTAATITSVSLTAGTWDCSASLARSVNAATSFTVARTSISATTNTSGTIAAGTMNVWTTAANVVAADFTREIGPIQVVPTATTSYYLVAEDTFTVNTNAGYGYLRCRRVA